MGDVDGLIRTLDMVNSSMGTLVQTGHTLEDNLYCAKYEKSYQLSNGAFSSVFCVRLRSAKNSLFAAKHLARASCTAEREAEILGALKRCAQVVPFVEGFHCKFHTIVVTELLSGGDLFERVSKPDYRLTEEKCQIFMRQIIQGLEYIHAQNIVHLDIKPYNILFSSPNADFGLKIIDFGLARRLHEDGQTDVKELQGTVEFIAPELISCKSASTASDMWSAGVVAYMLLSGGVSPFYSGSRHKTMARVLHSDFSLEIPELANTSEDAVSLVRQLLVSGAESRLSAKACLQHPWLVGEHIYIDMLQELETTWMRRCLARRRWYRALNALKAMHTMQKLTFPETVPDLEVLAEMVTKAPTRVAIVEPCLGEPKDFEVYKELYESVVQVGSGTFGSVYFVRERETGECAAAKYLRQEKHKVRREAEVLRSLIQSAFVVQLVGLFESPLNSVLVTEYLAGGDLITRTAPDDYCLTERKCQIFIRQIVRGVQFIHSQRILHLDLKPFNIMFANPDDDYNLRIIDFGLSETLENTEDGQVKMTMCGTLEYMSPEVMDCKFASPASDMWGVGVITYTLLSGGVSPFWGGNRYRTMAKTLSCDYTLDLPNFEHVSDAGKDFIKNLLVLDPSERHTAAQALQHPWLTDNRVYVEVLYSLETSWMKGMLARRRWQRWYNAIAAMNRMKQLQR